MGLPEEGQAVYLAVKIAGQSERTIHFHGEYAWESGSRVPMLALSRRFLQRAVIVVKTPAAVRSQFKASGLRVLDASAAALEKLEPISEGGAAGREAREKYANTDVHAFAFSEPGARLELVSEALEPMREAGVVREAVLATSIDKQGTALHRLRMLVHCGRASSLDLVLAPGMSLVRVRRDGTDVAVIESGTSVSISMPAGSQGAKLFTVTVEYVAAGEAGFRSGLTRAGFPRYPFPVFRSHGRWSLQAVMRRSIADLGWRRREPKDGRVGRMGDLSFGDEHGSCWQEGGWVGSMT